MTELRERLAALPSFPDDMPVLDAEAVPADPDVLFRTWLDDAIDSGARQPHAGILITARPDGTPVGRALIIKDIDEHGYQFATHRTSRKGQELASNPRASLVYFWSGSGRQVRITGDAVALPDDISQADWRARPNYDGRPNPDWQLYALVPDEFEFLQSRLDRKHTRVEYSKDADGQWTHAPVTTPAG